MVQTSLSWDSVGDSVVVDASVVEDNDRDGEKRGEENTQGTTNKNKKIMEGMRLSGRLGCRPDVGVNVANDNHVNAECEEVSVEEVFWLSDIEE